MFVRRLAGACVLCAALLAAQEWKTATTLPGVDFSGLTAAQKTAVLKVLREHECTCGCGMKMAECRVQDPGCGFSRGMAGIMVDALRAGKTINAALAAADASRFAHPPTPKLLDDPVTIPTAGSPMKGAENGRITLVEFSDFQCPYCAKAIHQIDDALAAYPNQVKLIFKQFPLDSHPQASISAAAALAAHRQGKFWQMHDALFANRTRLSRKTILEVAQSMGLDMKRFTADLDSPDIKKAIDKDVQDGDRAGVEATPTVFVNGKRYNGSLELDAFKKVLDAELQPKTKASAAPGPNRK